MAVLQSHDSAFAHREDGVVRSSPLGRRDRLAQDRLHPFRLGAPRIAQLDLVMASPSHPPFLADELTQHLSDGQLLGVGPYVQHLGPFLEGLDPNRASAECPECGVSHWPPPDEG